MNPPGQLVRPALDEIAEHTDTLARADRLISQALTSKARHACADVEVIRVTALKLERPILAAAALKVLDALAEVEAAL